MCKSFLSFDTIDSKWPLNICLLHKAFFLKYDKNTNSICLKKPFVWLLNILIVQIAKYYVTKQNQRLFSYETQPTLLLVISSISISRSIQAWIPKAEHHVLCMSPGTCPPSRCIHLQPLLKVTGAPRVAFNAA